MDAPDDERHDERDEPEADDRFEDDEPADGEPGAGGEVPEEVTYELHDRSQEARALLEQLLAADAIARVWSGTDLAVHASDEARVDELLDEVDATLSAVLDPDAEKTVYEVNDWSMDQLGLFTGALGEAGIPYEFDIEGDLAVLVEDEDRVEELLDGLGFGELDGGDDEGDADDGLETAAILSDLFVAVDRLHNNPHDADGILGAVSAADRLDGRSLPFGFEPRVWAGLIERSQRLKSMIEDDQVADELITEDATELRTLLRAYV